MKIHEVDATIESLANVWAPYLDKEAVALFSKWGYYSQKVKLDDPAWKDVKIISINSEQCNNMNWYLWSTLNDPNGEIAWIESELKASEIAGEKVIIIAHYPSVSCLHNWGMRYRALVERYQHVIRLQVWGHSHDEQWYLNRGFDDGHPIMIQYGNPSLGTRDGKNPGFRIYTLDAETMLPIEATRYFLNTTEANNGNPVWRKMFETTEEYEMKSFKPSDYYDFTESWSHGNVDKLKLAIINEDGRWARTSIDQLTCDAGCIKNNQCRWRSSENWERDICEGRPHYDFINNLEGSVEQLLAD